MTRSVTHPFRRPTRRKEQDLLAFFFILLLVTLSACTGRAAPLVKLHFVDSEGRATPTFEAEIAHTHGQRQLGLMYRKTLNDDQGMLFIFPGEEPRSFWMKNTYLELDMIFMDARQQVVSVIHRAVPLTESPRPSNKPAQYVLEIRGGRARELGIAPGSKMVVAGELPAPQ